MKEWKGVRCSLRYLFCDNGRLTRDHRTIIPLLVRNFIVINTKSTVLECSPYIVGSIMYQNILYYEQHVKVRRASIVPLLMARMAHCSSTLKSDPRAALKILDSPIAELWMHPWLMNVFYSDCGQCRLRRQLKMNFGMAIARSVYAAHSRSPYGHHATLTDADAWQQNIVAVFP